MTHNSLKNYVFILKYEVDSLTSHTLRVLSSIFKKIIHILHYIKNSTP